MGLLAGYLVYNILQVYLELNWPWPDLKANTLPLNHGIILFEFTMLALIYRSELNKILPKPTIPIAIAVFLIVGLTTILWKQGLWKFPSITFTLEALLGNALIFGYFYSLYKEIRMQRLTRQFMFWLGAGYLFYFNGNLLRFMFANFLNHAHGEIAVILAGFGAVLAGMLAIFQFLAIICNDKKQGAEPEIGFDSNHPNAITA